MTGLYVASRSVELARADVGYHEGPNNRNKFSYWQYGSYYNPWCASATSYWAYYAGFRFAPATFGDKGENNVAVFHRWALGRGLWRNRSTTARPGWFVNLNFGMEDGHIELVLADAGGANVATIGGNTGDMVAYRVRNRRDINGFIALDEAGQNASGPTPPPVEQGAPLTTVASPQKGVPTGRTPTARAVPAFNVVALENGARIDGDRDAGGGKRTWRHSAVSPTAKLIDIAATVYPKGHTQEGQPDGDGIVALYDEGNGVVTTYEGHWTP